MKRKIKNQPCHFWKKKINYLPTTTKRNSVVAIFIFDPVLIITTLKISKNFRISRNDPENLGTRDKMKRKDRGENFLAG